MKLDRIDLKILEIVREDGRISAARLSKRLCLSSSPTWQRVRRLEQAGLIRGYHADVAVERLADQIAVIVSLTLQSHHASDFRHFEQAIENVPEIVECFAVGGGVDYVLRFVTPTIERYQAIVDQLLQAEVGIHQYWSYVVTKPIIPFTGVPLVAFLPSMDEAECD